MVSMSDERNHGVFKNAVASSIKGAEMEQAVAVIPSRGAAHGTCRPRTRLHFDQLRISRLRVGHLCAFLCVPAYFLCVPAFHCAKGLVPSCAASPPSAGYHKQLSKDRRSLTRGHTPFI